MRLSTAVYTLLLSLLYACSTKEVNVEISNNLSVDRSNENVELSWDSIVIQDASITATNLVITNQEKEIPYQFLYNDKQEVVGVLFQASVEANGTTTYQIKSGTPQVYASNTHGRFVPERKDDFAWENNKVAFRMYGPALEATGEVSNGIDVMAKRTNKLVLDGWYKTMDYHKDKGEGLDYYKVGRTLGAGAMAPFIDSAIVLGNNYTDYQVIENGPIRTTFELSYAPFMADDKEVVEKRRVSLSANSHFCEMEVTFNGDFDHLPVASGIVLREDKGVVAIDRKDGYVSYQEPVMGSHGQLYIATLLGDRFLGTVVKDGHQLALTNSQKGEPITYHIGAGWSKFGITSNEQWLDVVDHQALVLKNPLKVRFQ